MPEANRGFEYYKQPLTVYSPAECAAFYNYVLARGAIIRDREHGRWCLVEDEAGQEFIPLRDKELEQGPDYPMMVFQSSDIQACRDRLALIEEATSRPLVKVDFLEGLGQGVSPFIIGTDDWGNYFQIHDFDRLFRPTFGFTKNY